MLSTLLLRESSQVIVIVAKSIKEGIDYVLAEHKGSVGALSGTGTPGCFKIGIHRVVVTSPRSAGRVRGLVVSSAVVLDHSAFISVYSALAPAMQVSPSPALYTRAGQPFYILAP